ncbi:MAG TPA: HAMP domain-containing sensor histidine kinase [Chloroflexota bacterium]|nr:HAMP domain-containing sensor histidine kinase [Chloroflexota bacterium]
MKLLQWPRAGRAEDAAAEPLRRISRQLAALVVGLICVLVAALLTVVYFRTQATSLDSLRSTLRERAESEVYHLTALDQAGMTNHAGPVGHASPPGQALRESIREEQERGELFIVFADARLKVLGGALGPFEGALADRAAAAEAMRRRAPVYSTRETSGDQTYLICSVPAISRGSVAGVVQTGASERSYEQNLHALLISMLLVSVFGLAASLGITWLVIRLALTPIRSSLAHQRDFVADAAHELRAPLAILRTAAELWLEPASMDDQQVAVEQVLSQGSHLARLVDDLSLLARADSGAVSIAHERVDLPALIRETVSGVELVAEEGGTRLEVRADDLWIRGDPGRLRQLLLILLDNALRHAPESETVTVTARRQGGHAVVSVRDRGPGIDQRDMPRLFDRFYRADRARAGEGTGLGLAIARWIAMAHGGQIRAANAPDGGSVFTLTLPLGGQ